MHPSAARGADPDPPRRDEIAVYFTDRGIEELVERRGDEEVSLAWLADRLQAFVDAHPDFERLAPVPFSVVCFRWNPAGVGLTESDLDEGNDRLIDTANRSGDVFISHTRIRGRLAIRIAIGHLRTTEAHVRRAWDLLIQHARALTT